MRGRYGRYAEPEEHAGPTQRLFVGVPLPEEVRERVVAIVEAAQAAVAIDPGPPPVRWVRLDGLHLTLKFLGATPEPRVPLVASAVRAAVRGFEPFEAAIGGAGAFPSPARPRAIWLGVPAGGEGLARLAAAVDEALEREGWPRDERPFRAHLTLARSDGVRAGPATAAALRNAAAGISLPWTVDRVVVYQSLMGHGPARYEALAEVPLAG